MSFKGCDFFAVSPVTSYQLNNNLHNLHAINNMRWLCPQLSGLAHSQIIRVSTGKKNHKCDLLNISVVAFGDQWD